jgi:6-pyruvoyltetrahydropterin/6-carboxytetrahydropterin synthase
MGNMINNEIVRVTKTFSFDMAHALFDYDGPCRNIHGHTYQLHITLKGIPIKDTHSPKQGMVLDFGDLKRVVQKKVIDRYDHALVLNLNSDYGKEKLFVSHFEKVHYVDFQPTCENLLLAIKDSLTGEFPMSVELIRVRLDETPTSYSEWFLEDN